MPDADPPGRQPSGRQSPGAAGAGAGLDARPDCPAAEAGRPPGPGPRSRRGGLIGLLRAHAVDVRPLSVPPYRRLLIGQTTSFIGSMLTSVAVPVQVYAITGSSMAVGLVGLVGFAPLVILGLYGGAVADAMDRRVLYFVASLGAWAVTLALLAQSLLGLSNVGLIMGLVAIQSGAFAMSGSARGALIPRIVPLELVPAANTLNATSGNIGMVAGPLLAGAVLGMRNGFAIAYGADAVLFTAALYTCFRLPSIPPTGGDRAGALGVRSVVDGLRFILANPVLLMSFAVDIVAMVFAMPKALFPAVAAAKFGGGVGPLYAAIAIGAMAAGLASGWVGRVRRQGVALTLSVIGWGIAVAAAGLAPALWVVVALLAVAGAADFVSGVYRQTILQTYAPDEMRGRMQGVFIAVVAGGPRLGDLRAGATASVAGPTASWVGGGALCAVVVVIAGLAVRPFWNYRVKLPADGSPTT